MYNLLLTELFKNLTEKMNNISLVPVQQEQHHERNHHHQYIAADLAALNKPYFA